MVQHVITNLCMGLQVDQLHGMVMSSPTVQLPELTVSLQAQSSLDPPIMSVESQALSPETSTVAQTSHNTYTIPVPPEPTSAHIQQDYVNQSVSIDDQSSRELNNNNSENNFTLIDRLIQFRNPWRPSRCSLSRKPRSRRQAPSRRRLPWLRPWRLRRWS